jgi:hypothetical protein
MRGPSPLHQVRCSFCGQFADCRCLPASGPDHRLWCAKCDERYVNASEPRHARSPRRLRQSDVVIRELARWTGIGGEWGLQIVTPAAREWVTANVAQARWLGTTLVVDGRQALMLGAAMVRAGLVVRQARS